jgi:hypothetical protein
VEILWWLAPPVVATVLAMLWVSWLGREGRGEVDRDVAVRRLGAAMDKPLPARSQQPHVAASADDRSNGVAVRPSTRPAAPTRRAS